MGTIVCRHRNETVFDRLADNYSRSTDLWTVALESNKLIEVRFDTQRITADIEREEKKKGDVLLYLPVMKAKKPGLETPNIVVKDANLGKNAFISLCGHICSNENYEPTGERHDVTQILRDIYARQPKPGSYSSGDVDIEHKILHFSEIPSDCCFSKVTARDFNYGYFQQRISKYHKQEIYPANVKEQYLYGKYCPFVDAAFYENENFYEDDIVWHNPGKKFVQINHAVTHESFFDRDGYLCSIYNYRLVNEEEVRSYYKKFLFLV